MHRLRQRRCIRRREQQLVVVAAGERRARVDVRADGYGLEVDLGAYRAGGADVSEIGQEPVGDVDGCRSHPAQRNAEGEPGFDQVETRVAGEPGRVADAEGAGYVHPVAGTCARPGEGQAPGHDAVRRHGDAQRSSGEVAAHHGHAMARGGVGQAPGKGLDPGDVRLRRGQRHHAVARLGTHRGEVGQVDAQRACSEQVAGRFGREVPAGHQRVRRDREIETGGYGDDGGVVPRSEQHALASGPLPQDRDDPVDQGELVHQVSAARRSRATRSRTPLTYLKLSSAPKVFARRTYSSIATR